MDDKRESTDDKRESTMIITACTQTYTPMNRDNLEVQGAGR